MNSLAGAYRAGLEHDLAENGRSANFSARYVRNKLQVLDGAQGYGDLRAFFTKPLYVLMAMVGTLLLIACANVANLLITRAQGRQKEISIRLALGASRGSLMRLIMTESLLIAASGGVLGLLLSDWIASLLVSLLPFRNIGAAIQTSPDWRILAFTAAVSLFAALLAGAAPAFEASRPDLAPALKNESRSASLSLGQTRFRRALICGQVALSFLLLAAAGLFARSLYKLMAVDSGMETSRLLAFSIDPSMHNYTPWPGAAAVPGFAGSARAYTWRAGSRRCSYAVLADNNWQNTVHIEGYKPANGEEMNPGYNEMLLDSFPRRVPLIAGRDFQIETRTARPKS